MTYSIIGSGAVGAALARQFARSGVTVGIANRRGPGSMASLANELGNRVVPLTLQEALKADMIILAVPFWSHRDVAKTIPTWQGKVVVDATNAYGVPLSDLDDLPSSAIVAKALPGARLVKGFNHLPAAVLAQDPVTTAGRRVIFLSSDDEGATNKVARPGSATRLRTGQSRQDRGRRSARAGTRQELGAPDFPRSVQAG
jgi:8-hydroxy-5-deazaflavin:NADPH oxidoreductase